MSISESADLMKDLGSCPEATTAEIDLFRMNFLEGNSSAAETLDSLFDTSSESEVTGTPSLSLRAQLMALCSSLESNTRETRQVAGMSLETRPFPRALGLCTSAISPLWAIVAMWMNLTILSRIESLGNVVAESSPPVSSLQLQIS